MRITTVVVALAALCRESWAEPTAETLYSEGQAAYERADYAGAIDRWQESYRLSQEPALIYNVAQAYRMAGDCTHALLSYRQFVSADPTSERRPFADEFVRELERECGTPSKVNQVPRVENPNPNSGRGMKSAGLVTGAAGGVLVITGLLFGRRATRIGDDVSKTCAQGCDWGEQRSRDAEGRRAASIGYALDAIGIAAIAGGGVMYYLGWRTSAITAAPRPSDNGAIVTWSGTW